MARAAPGPSRDAILAERHRRQRFRDPLPTRRGYTELLRLLQPVSPISDARPGDPPRLVCRTRFDDGKEADRLRARRQLVKGRFLGGSLGYVLAEDLALYANALCRPLAKPAPAQRAVLDAVRCAGPLTPRQLKEETGLLNRQIMPALHRMQRAFLVYEDQVDRGWDRAWFDFESEWPDVALDERTRDAAREQVLLRFLAGHVFATPEQLRDWSGLPQRTLARLIGELEARGALRALDVPTLGSGWLRAGERLPSGAGPPRGVFPLHRADPLVRSHRGELGRRFRGREVLRYLLVDGAFLGAVLGHWRFAPYDVEDVVLELPAAQRQGRRAEVLRAVRDVYAPPRHHILRYAGRPVRGEDR